MTNQKEPILCSVYVQNKGWLPFVGEGEVAGTSGESLRIEGIKITGVDRYRVFMQDRGWGFWTDPGEIAGTIGQGLRIEAIEIQGDGVNYHAHVQNFGWMNWASNGETAGTIDRSLRLEALQIMRSPKPLNVSCTEKFKKLEPKKQPEEPTKNLSGLKICLDAGHGGSDGGAVSTIKESDMNLNVIMRLGELLSKSGAEIIYTRTDNSELHLSERTDIANASGADLFVSVHHNGSSNPQSNGSEVICYPGSTNSLRLAESVLNQLSADLKTYKRGITQRDDYTVTYTNMPAIITEACFVSNPVEVANFLNGACQTEAVAIYKGITNYLGK